MPETHEHGPPLVVGLGVVMLLWVMVFLLWIIGDAE